MICGRCCGNDRFVSSGAAPGNPHRAAENFQITAQPWSRSRSGAFLMPSTAAQDRPGTRRPCPSFTPSQIKPHSPAQTATAAPAPGTAAQSERGLFAAPSHKPQKAPHSRFCGGCYPTLPDPKSRHRPAQNAQKSPLQSVSRSAGAEKRSCHAARGRKWAIFDPFFGKFPPDFRGISKKFSEKIRPPWVGKRISRFIVDSR